MFAIHFSNFDDRHVERTTTQVINDDSVVALRFVHTVSQSSRGRFVDDALNVQTGNTTCVFSCLTLAVVEVSRNCNNSFGHWLAEVIFGGFLHFFQNFSRDLWRCHFLAVHFIPSVTIVCLDDFVRHHLDVFLYNFFVKTTTDQTLHRVQGVMRIGHCLTLGRLANQNFAIVGVRNDRRRSARAFCVFNNFCLAVFQNRHTRVGGAQVNTDNSAHVNSP